jgi:hypothetical protein
MLAVSVISWVLETVEVVIFVELTLVVAWVFGLERGHRSLPAEKCMMN